MKFFALVSYTLFSTLALNLTFETRALAELQPTVDLVTSERQKSELHREWTLLKEMIASFEPDEKMVGGLMFQVDFGDHVLLWSKNSFAHDGHEVLRIFVPRSEHQRSFDITYILSKYLSVASQERPALRRFVGPAERGWRADTVNWLTGDWIDTQGNRNLRLTDFEQELLEKYSIQLQPY